MTNKSDVSVLLDDIRALTPIVDCERFADWTRKEKDAYAIGFADCRDMALCHALAATERAAIQPAESIRHDHQFQKLMNAYLHAVERSMDAFEQGDALCAYIDSRAPVAAIQPAGDAVKRRDIFAICDAYESGIGHGLQLDGHKSGAIFGNPECGKAYEIGYELGEERAHDKSTPAAPVASAPAQPDFDTWKESPYTKALESSIKHDYVPRPTGKPTVSEMLAASCLPERDQSKPAEQQGIFHKFDVRRTDGSDQPGGKHYGCNYFVLDMAHDAHAATAMRAYADSCRATHPQLAADIDADFAPAQPMSLEAERDTARLDFVLDRQAFIMTIPESKTGRPPMYQLMEQDEDEDFHVISGEGEAFRTKRAAIDAARAALATQQGDKHE